MSEAVGAAARKTAVGMAAHAAAGREDEANMLLHMYLRDARDAGMIVPVALVALVKTLTSMAIAIAGEDASEKFQQMANTIVMAES
jgi:protein subunit release factor B